MYKPPENSNRVKSIKSKFENIEKSSNLPDARKNAGSRNHLNQPRLGKTDILVDKTKLTLQRQLSDPAKRNIKRTPAFRLDKNIEKNAFQRSAPNQRSCYFDNKVKQLSSALKNNCDKSSPTEDAKATILKPLLIKSKSSHDFAYIRSKFDNNNEKTIKNTENQRQFDNGISTKTNDLSLLYTEPIPKSLRSKVICDNHVYSNVDFNKSDTKEIVTDIYSADTLKVSDKNKTVDLADVALTDTLKSALKKPLPCGPAPKKPPRTFEHNTPKKELKNLEKNKSFLHLKHDLDNIDNESKNKTINSKRDPRYMLNKLEHALRNNKIKMKKLVAKAEASTTSGEDSDDSVLFRSKSKRDLPEVPASQSHAASSFKLNCFTGLTQCKSSLYEKIGESNSAFFVSCDEEPVYAEPFSVGDGGRRNERNVRNSLYYMSTPLLRDDRKHSVDENSNNKQGCEVVLSANDDKTSHKQISAESSSLSSFTSDLDSTTSTPMEEVNNSFESTLKIKQLINTFETKQRNPNSTKKPIDVSSNRVEDLKMSLQKTLDKCFTADSPETEDKAISVVDVMIDKFQTYIKTMPKYQKPKLGKNDRLFYCCLIVGWDSKIPQIKFKFPSNVKIPDKIEDLCFPEAASGPLDKSDNAQCYSLVITNDKGERTFGYCRRVIPEGSSKCIPLAYCILSKHRAPRFYKQILTELESRHGIPDKIRDELISEFYFNKFPRPGESIKINLTSIIRDLNEFKKKNRVDKDLQESTELVDSLDLTSFVHVNKTGEYGTLNKVKKSAAHRSYENIFISDSESICSPVPRLIVESGGKTELILTLHHDTRYEEADLKPLHKLPPDVLLKIFASLLLERKVVFISCVISKLSCCVDALQSILYPFSWPHTFIPILPQCLWDVVESPTPVICGILSVAVVNEYKIEHGIVVDLDEGDILIEEGDENSILSDSMKKAWRQGLNLANTIPPEDYVHAVYLSDAYIKVFITALKHYKNHISNGVFDKDTFIRNGKSKGIRRFLKWFCETTLFLSFIDSVINNPESFSLFDNKIVTYGSEESNLIMTKLLEWKK